MALWTDNPKISSVFGKEKLIPARIAVDHLLLGAAVLDQGIALVKEKTGLSPIIGGTHPGVGTRNALLSLGDRQYLEIIAPDPSQETLAFQIDLRELSEPRLITWAALAKSISAEAEMARAAGFEILGPREGSRRRPDGRMLRWRTMAVRNSYGSSTVAPIPFFIEWGSEVTHPSQDALTGCRLESLEFAHPEAAKVAEMLRRLGIEGLVKPASESRLTARLWTPKGNWTLS